MSLIDRINDDLKNAMRAKDQTRLGAVRALRGKVLEAAKSGADKETSDEDVLAMVKYLIKQRRQSIVEFQKGNREDLIAKEEAEIAILEGYLPPQLSDAELDAIVAAAIVASGASDIKGMGAVMGKVKQAVAATGKDADNALVASKVKAALS